MAKSKKLPPVSVEVFEDRIFKTLLVATTRELVNAFLSRATPVTLFSGWWIDSHKFKTALCEPKTIETPWGQIVVEEEVEVPLLSSEKSSVFMLRGYVCYSISPFVAEIILGIDSLPEMYE